MKRHKNETGCRAIVDDRVSFRRIRIDYHGFNLDRQMAFCVPIGKRLDFGDRAQRLRAGMRQEIEKQAEDREGM